MTRKEQIVETAIELFATESFESVSIQKLANETGVAQGLLYRHFKGKDDLLKHLILKGLEQVSITLQPYSDSSLSFEQAFARHLKRSLQYLHSDYKLWKVLHNTRQNAALMTALDFDLDPRQALVQPIKRRLLAEGIREAETKAWLVFTLIDGITGLYLANPEHYPLKKMEKLLTENIINYVS